MVPARTLHKGNLAASWVNKVLDNPLPLGAGALVVGLLQLRRIREREERKAASGVKKEEEVELAEEWKVIIPSCSVPGIKTRKHLLVRCPATSRCPCDTFQEPGVQSMRFNFLVSFRTLFSPPMPGVPIPKHPLIQLHRAFGCNLEEAENPSLSSYPTLGAFFRRRLKSGVRPVADACLVSPADGKVLHWGPVGEDEAEDQVVNQALPLSGVKAQTQQWR